MNKNIFKIVILFVLFSGCKKFDLPRNNPLDNKSESGSSDIKFSKYLVVYDTNGNGVINKNESIKLKIYLKNIGTKKANKIKAVISCSNSYISNISPKTSIPFNSHSLSADDYIPQNEERFGYSGFLPTDYTIEFNVLYGAYSGASAIFTLNITDEASNQWTENFTITIY